jgi:hypothetical protein
VEVVCRRVAAKQIAVANPTLEPAAPFTGEAVHAYLGHLSDAAIEAKLNELATELGAALGQERIYVARPDLDF